MLKILTLSVFSNQSWFSDRKNSRGGWTLNSDYALLYGDKLQIPDYFVKNKNCWDTLRKGSSDGIPSDDATTANARAVVFLTYSSMLSMSGRIVEIMVAKPAALARLEMISRPSTRA